MNPQVTDILAGAASLLADPAQEQFTNAVLLPWYQAAYREAYDLVMRWGLPVGERDCYFYLPANTTILIPSVAGITDIGEPFEVWERPAINAHAVSAVSNTTPVQVTTTTPHNLAEGAPCELSGIVGPIGVNGVEWRVHVVDSLNVQLNGSIAGGPYSSGGTLISGGEESANPFAWVTPIRSLPQVPQDITLKYWRWEQDRFLFNGATGPVELWIQYRSSGNPPTSGSVGWDNSQNFLQYRTASLAASQYDMQASGDKYTLLALGPSGEPDGSGGALRGFAYPMLKEKQKRPVRPRTFRPRRNTLNRIW